MTPQEQLQLAQKRADKLARCLDRIEALVRAELRSNVGPPISPVLYDIQEELDSLEVKTS